MKRKLIIALLAISLASAFVGCKNNSSTEKSDSKQKNEVVLEELDYSYDDSDGYREIYVEEEFVNWKSCSFDYKVLGIDGKELQHRDVKTVREGEDFKFSIDYLCDIKPIPQETVSCTATAYVNYKQVEFFSEGNKNKIEKLDFEAKVGEKINLPFILPTEGLQGSNKVMIVIQCNEFAGKGMISNLESTVAYMVDLNVGHKTGYEKTDEKATYKTITYPINNVPNESDFFVNQNFKVENEKSEGLCWDKLAIKVKRGEEFPLAFRFGRINEDSIIFLTIDNKQHKIDGEDYLYFEASENLLYRKCMVKAPEKAGTYLLSGYYKNSPWEYGATRMHEFSRVAKLIVE